MSLRNALVSVLTPTDQMKKLANDLGVELSTSALKSKGLAEYLGELATATQGNTEAINAFFGGARNMTAVLALASDGAQDFKNALDTMKEGTTALDNAFAVTSKSLDTQIQAMKNSIQNLAIAFGEAIQPMIKGLTDFISGFVDWVREAPAWQKAIMGVGLALASLVPIIKGVSTAFSMLRTAMGDVWGLISLLGIGIAGTVATVGTVSTAISDIGDKSKDAEQKLKPLETTLKEISTHAQKVGDSAEKLAKNITPTVNDAKALLDVMKELPNGVADTQDKMNNAKFVLEKILDSGISLGKAIEKTNEGYTVRLDVLKKELQVQLDLLQTERHRLETEKQKAVLQAREKAQVSKEYIDTESQIERLNTLRLLVENLNPATLYGKLTGPVGEVQRVLTGYASLFEIVEKDTSGTFKDLKTAISKALEEFKKDVKTGNYPNLSNAVRQQVQSITSASEMLRQMPEIAVPFVAKLGWHITSAISTVSSNLAKRIDAEQRKLQDLENKAVQEANKGWERQFTELDKKIAELQGIISKISTEKSKTWVFNVNTSSAETKIKELQEKIDSYKKVLQQYATNPELYEGALDYLVSMYDNLISLMLEAGKPASEIQSFINQKAGFETELKKLKNAREKLQSSAVKELTSTDYNQMIATLERNLKDESFANVKDELTQMYANTLREYQSFLQREIMNFIREQKEIPTELTDELKSVSGKITAIVGTAKEKDYEGILKKLRAEMEKADEETLKVLENTYTGILSEYYNYLSTKFLEELAKNPKEIPTTLLEKLTWVADEMKKCNNRIVAKADEDIARTIDSYEAEIQKLKEKGDATSLRIVQELYLKKLQAYESKLQQEIETAIREGKSPQELYVALYDVGRAIERITEELAKNISTGIQQHVYETASSSYSQLYELLNDIQQSANKVFEAQDLQDYNDALGEVLAKLELFDRLLTEAVDLNDVQRESLSGIRNEIEQIVKSYKFEFGESTGFTEMALETQRLEAWRDSVLGVVGNLNELIALIGDAEEKLKYPQYAVLELLSQTENNLNLLSDALKNNMELAKAFSEEELTNLKMLVEWLQKYISLKKQSILEVEQKREFEYPEQEKRLETYRTLVDKFAQLGSVIEQIEALRLQLPEATPEQQKEILQQIANLQELFDEARYEAEMYYITLDQGTKEWLRGLISVGEEFEKVDKKFNETVENVKMQLPKTVAEQVRYFEGTSESLVPFAEVYENIVELKKQAEATEDLEEYNKLVEQIRNNYELLMQAIENLPEPAQEFARELFEVNKLLDIQNKKVQLNAEQVRYFEGTSESLVPLAEVYENIVELKKQAEATEDLEEYNKLVEQIHNNYELLMRAIENLPEPAQEFARELFEVNKLLDIQNKKVQLNNEEIEKTAKVLDAYVSITETIIEKTLGRSEELRPLAEMLSNVMDNVLEKMKEGLKEGKELVTVFQTLAKYSNEIMFAIQQWAVGEVLDAFFIAIETVAKMSESFDKMASPEHTRLGKMIKTFNEYEKLVKERQRLLAQQGAEVVGATAVGAIAGLLLGGPLGALIGAGLGAVIGGAMAKSLDEQIKEIEEKLKVNLGEIAKALGTDIETIAGAVERGLKADTYEEFVQNFGESLEKATKTALIRAFLASETMQPLLENLSNAITLAVLDGVLSPEELEVLKQLQSQLTETAKPFFDALMQLFPALPETAGTGTIERQTVGGIVRSSISEQTGGMLVGLMNSLNLVTQDIRDILKNGTVNVYVVNATDYARYTTESGR